MTTDYISEHDGPTLAERQWWHQEAQAMSTEVKVLPAPAVPYLFIGHGLRPVGQTIGLTTQWFPDTTPDKKARGGSTSAKVADDGTATAPATTFTLTGITDPAQIPPGTVKWWWHDGADELEPPIGGPDDQGTFRLGDG